MAKRTEHADREMWGRHELTKRFRSTAAELRDKYHETRETHYIVRARTWEEAADAVDEYCRRDRN